LSQIEKTNLHKLNELKGESIGLFCFADERPLAGVAGCIDWRICGQLSRVLQNEFFSAETSEMLMLPVSGRFGTRRLFLFGLGAADAWNAKQCAKVLKHAALVMRKAGVDDLVLAAPARFGAPEVETQFAEIACRELGNTLSRVLVSGH
jgi:hypothetical protein